MMVTAGNKAKRLSSVNHTTKTIHRHHHHHHHHHQAVVGFGTTYGNNKKIKKKKKIYGNYIFLLIKNLEFFHYFKD